MNTNQDNSIVRVFAAIVDTIARSLVVLFDGLRNAIDHASPSAFGLLAVVLPFAMPLPIAWMTSKSAQDFFGWEPWAANTLGAGLEGLGILVWVRLVDAIITSDNKSLTNSLTFLWAVAIAYEALLIAVNVILAWREGADTVYALTLLLICALPALSAAMFGIHRRETTAILERERIEEKELQEKIRQEKRADRKELQELKLKYASETDHVEEQPGSGGKFRKRKK